MNFDVLYVVLPCIGIAADIVSGYVAAACNGRVDSKKMRRGIYGKLGELIAIAIGFLAEWGIVVFGAETIGLSVNMPIGLATCAYVFVTELVSILENIGSISPNLGESMVRIFGIDRAKVHLNEGKNDADSASSE